MIRRRSPRGFTASTPALVGIASFFFFQPGVASIPLMLVGCVISTVLTWLMRKYLAFPHLHHPLHPDDLDPLFRRRQPWARSGSSPARLFAALSVFQAVANGVSQVMFQANIWTALFFVAGIAISEWRHAVWVVARLGPGRAGRQLPRHAGAAARRLDPERLINRFLSENISLGLYSYNATLPAVALFLWRKSLIPPLLGVLLSVPLTELVPKLGLPALTAPFVLATWIVLALGFFDRKFLHPEAEA